MEVELCSGCCVISCIIEPLPTCLCIFGIYIVWLGMSCVFRVLCVHCGEEQDWPRHSLRGQSEPPSTHRDPVDGPPKRWKLGLCWKQRQEFSHKLQLVS